MEFSVARKDLLKELKLLDGCVEKKSTIPILSSVLVEAKGDSLILTASDLETSLRCSCPAKVKKEGGSTIPAKLLLHYVQLLPEADITFRLQDNYWMALNCARSKAKIAGMSRDSFPSLAEPGELLAEIPIGQLSSMIGRCDFAISREESRFTLQGALLVLTAHSMVMVATDGHRLSFVDVKREAGAAGRVMVPIKALSQLLRLASEEESATLVQISRGGNSLFFRIRDRLLIAHELTGNFPDYNRVLPKDAPHLAVIDRETLAAAINRVAQFSDERSHAIRLSFGKDELKLDSSSIEIGESEDGIPVDYQGPPLTIGFSSVYLLDFLKSISSEKQVTLHFTDSKSALEMRPVSEKQEYRYVVMPMRV